MDVIAIIETNTIRFEMKISKYSGNKKKYISPIKQIKNMKTETLTTDLKY